MEGRDSFILYTEQKEVIDKLTDEQAGKLIKAIYQYVKTDDMPVLEPMLDIIITPFRQNLDRNKEKYQKVSEVRAKAGAKGGKQKVANASKQKQNVAKGSKCYDNDNDNDNVNDNDNINKKTKIHFAEFVSMTNDEYNKLVVTHGKEFADQCISVLDNYKGANGKKYKSDYRAILSWVIDKVKKEGKINAKTPKIADLSDLEERYDNL